MIVVTVARRPLRAGNVASSVLTDECGALNIDASRVRGVPTSYPTRRNAHAPLPGDGRSASSQGMFAQPASEDLGKPHQGGRWPANLILEHKPGCRRDGTRKVKAHGDGTPRTTIRRSGVHSEAGGHQTVGAVMPVTSHADADGTETVDSWVCEPGCPVADLDTQSGAVGGGAKPRVVTAHEGRHDEDSWRLKPMAGTTRALGDVGGASRFFKQVGGQK